MTLRTFPGGIGGTASDWLNAASSLTEEPAIVERVAASVPESAHPDLWFEIDMDSSEVAAVSAVVDVT